MKLEEGIDVSLYSWLRMLRFVVVVPALLVGVEGSITFEDGEDLRSICRRYRFVRSM